MVETGGYGLEGLVLQEEREYVSQVHDVYRAGAVDEEEGRAGTDQEGVGVCGERFT